MKLYKSLYQNYYKSIDQIMINLYSKLLFQLQPPKTQTHKLTADLS